MNRTVEILLHIRAVFAFVQTVCSCDEKEQAEGNRPDLADALRTYCMAVAQILDSAPLEVRKRKSDSAPSLALFAEYEYEYDDQIVCAEVEKSLIEKKESKP